MGNSVFLILQTDYNHDTKSFLSHRQYQTNYYEIFSNKERIRETSII